MFTDVLLNYEYDSVVNELLLTCCSLYRHFKFTYFQHDFEDQVTMGRECLCYESIMCKINTVLTAQNSCKTLVEK